MPDTELNLCFDNSRRLTGPNRYFADPAVTLTPLGARARDGAALAAWVEHVRRICDGLGWPDPDPQIVQRRSEMLLVFRAPADALFTATEVNEWCWEQAASAAGDRAFDRTHDFEDPLTAFAARAAEEYRPALADLRAAARRRDIEFLEDDAQVSLGEGAGSRTWSMNGLPSVEAVPWGELHDVPTVLVTGSNGKTTTVRLLAAMAAAAGRVAGYCCTEGVFVGGAAVALGDYSGPEGARTVLRHAAVQAAVLETARGGILRRGLALRRATAAVITNISPDHLGEYGVDGAEDLAATKLVVAHAVARGGMLVVNSDDEVLMGALARRGRLGAGLALFAHSYDTAALLALRAEGGATCGVRDGVLLLSIADREMPFGKVSEMPLTIGGLARYNVGNLAAAALAAIASGLPHDAVRATLASFGADPLDNPGRLERWSFRGAIVLLDYAHNPDGLCAVLQVARALRPRRLLLLLGQAGNRGDPAIADLARTAASFAPDRIVVKELPLMLRGRSVGDVPALLVRGLEDAGVEARRITMDPDEASAAAGLLDNAEPGDVIVLPVHTGAVRDVLRRRLLAESAAAAAAGPPP